MEVLQNARLATVLLLTVAAVLIHTPSTSAEAILDLKETNYIQWNNNVTYISSTSYHAKGMAPVYVISNQIISLFMGRDVIPDGYISITSSPTKVDLGPKAKENDWSDLLRQYWLLLVVLCICALIIVLMPIIGFCFCCCRCAGACGGRSQPFDKKHDTCRRVFLGLLLILAGTGLIFGVVVAFVTNSYLQQGVENATTTARHGVDDTQKFMRTTSQEVNHLLVTNYEQLSSHLKEMLSETTDVVIDELEIRSKAHSLTQVANFANSIPQIKKDLNRMRDITNNLRLNASQLSDGLRGVKRELLQSLTKCGATYKPCRDVLDQFQIGKLDINGIDYNQIPDLTSMIDNVNEVLTEDTVASIIKGKQAFDNIRSELNTTISNNIPTVTDALSDAGAGVRQASSEVNVVLERISDAVGNNLYIHFDKADEYIQEYYKYVYYAGIALSSVLLLVLLCVVLGLLCGICGKRPDGYGDDCCNKGAGSRFLMIGVAVIFLTISILTAVALIYFLAGMLVRRGCVSLQNPTEDQVFKYIDQLVDLNEVLYPEVRRSSAKKRNSDPFRISQIIESCHANQSMFEVLRIGNYLDIRKISNLLKEYAIDEKLEELTAKIQIDTTNDILPDATKAGIVKLRDSELGNFDSDKFIDNLSKDIIQYNLSEIAQKLRETAEKIPEGLADVRTSLRNQALHLVTYQENLVDPMTEQTAEILDLTTKLDESFKFNRSSFVDGINSILTEIEDAKTFIDGEGTEYVQKVAAELLQGFIREINTYIGIVLKGMEEDLGRCGPLSNVYKSVLVAGCNRVVDPFNGFWLGIAWCTLLFLPTIIIAVKLSTLYQKSDPYPGPLVESEYLYDAYSERDNIPLANGMKNKRRKKDQRRRSSRDRRGDYYEDSGSPHGPREGPREARYNDMAPKHWDGGPPRYQNAPMAPPASEYERPPPYYFPGAPSEPE
ncbi:prominin-like protein isoform X5 [Bradysia coprophila]|uniref:prominin-like protein isoform X5 n=1 Tax=Bradysia coprophila TaxID=38358 RepID=UPI00187DA7B5|nr:prominin-like protein isoform X5 [Bradysia coprophila]